MKRFIAAALAAGCVVSSSPVFAGDDPGVFHKSLDPGAPEWVPASAFKAVSTVTNSPRRSSDSRARFTSRIRRFRESFLPAIMPSSTRAAA